MSQLTVKNITTAIVRRIRHQFVLFSSRKKSRKAIADSTGKNILVLCYGNIYRSPLVEYLLTRRDLTGAFSITSAGFYNKSGRCCDDCYLSLLKNKGYDLSNHRSSIVSKEDIRCADIILIMDRKNWDLVCQADKTAARKVVWIGAFNRKGPVEVDDPYGKSVEDIKDIICQIEDCVDSVYLTLNKWE